MTSDRVVEIRDANGRLIAWVRASELPLRGYDPTLGHEIFLATCADPERVYSALASRERRAVSRGSIPQRHAPITLEDLGL